jgi:hypothetical protein
LPVLPCHTCGNALEVWQIVKAALTFCHKPRQIASPYTARRATEIGGWSVAFACLPHLPHLFSIWRGKV